MGSGTGTITSFTSTTTGHAASNTFTTVSFTEVRTGIALVGVRASRVNGCAYGIDAHTTQAHSHGETEQRLHALDAWRVPSFFSGRERATLSRTESTTLISATHVPDCNVVDLTRAMIAINS